MPRATYKKAYKFGLMFKKSGGKRWYRDGGMVYKTKGKAQSDVKMLNKRTSGYTHKVVRL